MAEEVRFAFGRNWSEFIDRKFSQDRVDIARNHILRFVKKRDLSNCDVLDIGCGSGLHSLAALQAGARRIRSFDYDPASVQTAQRLWEFAHAPANWEISRGDVLDDNFVDSLGQWNFVYSWGVLHHTGDVWRAIDNAQRTVAPGGVFYIALYSADVQPQREYWLRIKKEYNAADEDKKTRMVWWYIWEHHMQRNPLRALAVLKRIASYRFDRGMDYFADIRDWLGGWPMEFVFDKDVIDRLENRHGFRLVNIATGHANTEFLFQK